jgi:hypothetical protein
MTGKKKPGITRLFLSHRQRFNANDATLPAHTTYATLTMFTAGITALAADFWNASIWSKFR